jgi:hypothetical protein
VTVGPQCTPPSGAPICSADAGSSSGDAGTTAGDGGAVVNTACGASNLGTACYFAGNAPVPGYVCACVYGTFAAPYGCQKTTDCVYPGSACPASTTAPTCADAGK